MSVLIWVQTVCKGYQQMLQGKREIIKEIMWNYLEHVFNGASLMAEENDQSKLGMVVFGVGIAGRVRIRDLKDPDYQDGGWKLVGFVSRRTLTIEGTQQLTEEDALTRSDVHAILVCSEPASHEDIIRKALNHNKHVLVEFPVATTATATKELYSLAKDKGLILHEENIGLLTPGYAEIKEKLKKSTVPVVKGEIKMVGNYNGWAEDFKKSGGPFCTSVSMIQTLYKLLGEDIKAVGGTLEENERGFTAVAKLTCSKCSKLSLSVRRTKERVKRDKTFLFEFENGHVMVEKPEGPQTNKTADSPQPKKIGLFMRDFLFFISEIKQKRDPTKDVQRSIHCMEVADDIHRFMGLTTAS